ncbi:MAG TPA: hypothetical protein PK432_02900, partial [Candidatus Dojkabacteria bacterium]|nr:hypothetical protein [Candidatus Dojkabacteria bacterium]
QYPDLVSQITQRGGLGFLNKSTHTMGTGRWSSSNPKNMFMNVLKQAYQNASTQAPVSTEVKGNIQLELIEDLVQQGVAKTTVRNYDRPSGIYKSAKTENLYNLVNRGKVKMVGDKIVGKGISYTLDEFGAAEGFGNWAGFTKAAKYAGKDLIAGKEVFLYDITAAGKKADKARPVFDSLPGKSSASTMTYAGIGSRQTPQEVLDKMTEVAKYLDDLGYTLNTGKTYPTKLNDYLIKTVHKGNKEAAEKAYKNKQAETERLSKLYGNTVGMDEEGADRAFSAGASKKNLFSPSDKIGQKEMKVGEEIHPNWSALSAGAAKLMARNTNQVFGENLDKPVDFVLFYAKEVKGSIRPEGGTGQAVEMARRKGIPTINMADENWRDQLKAIIKQRPTQQPLDFKTMPEFSLERKREILSNFANKHNITSDQAYQYINQALNDPSKKKEDIIKKLKECY